MILDLSHEILPFSAVQFQGTDIFHYAFLCLPLLAQQIRSEERELIVWCLNELEELALKAARYSNYAYACMLLYLLH